MQPIQIKFGPNVTSSAAVNEMATEVARAAGYSLLHAMAHPVDNHPYLFVRGRHASRFAVRIGADSVRVYHQPDREVPAEWLEFMRWRGIQPQLMTISPGTDTARRVISAPFDFVFPDTLVCSRMAGDEAIAFLNRLLSTVRAVILSAYCLSSVAGLESLTHTIRTEPGDIVVEYRRGHLTAFLTYREDIEAIAATAPYLRRQGIILEALDW